MRLLILLFSSLLLDVLPAGTAFLRPMQPRDSILVGDQLAYGCRLDSLSPGMGLALPDFGAASGDTLTLVRGWQLDTLKQKKHRAGDPVSIEASIVLAPFEEGRYFLPPIPVLRQWADRTDTLLFEGVEMEVKAIPIDTATFVIHDLKGQIRYPLTFAEVWPWVAGALALAALLALLVWLLLRALRRRQGAEEASREPAYIVALRQLEHFRSEKYWAPDKQKQYYSGITDALKVYMEDRFGVDAPEMTTAELFAALRAEKDIPKELREALQALFECADFVKFAKYTASDEQNAGALPLAVRFVTSTYQTQLDRQEAERAAENGGAEAAGKQG